MGGGSLVAAAARERPHSLVPLTRPAAPGDALRLPGPVRRGPQPRLPTERRRGFARVVAGPPRGAAAAPVPARRERYGGTAAGGEASAPGRRRARRAGRRLIKPSVTGDGVVGLRFCLAPAPAGADAAVARSLLTALCGAGRRRRCGSVLPRLQALLGSPNRLSPCVSLGVALAPLSCAHTVPRSPPCGPVVRRGRARVDLSRRDDDETEPPISFYRTDTTNNPVGRGSSANPNFGETKRGTSRSLSRAGAGGGAVAARPDV